MHRVVVFETVAATLAAVAEKYAAAVLA